ncbi:MAG: hypothetical protein GXY54_10250 [Deltaproteobacteria bacterium]|nr:hypothetical protein [Deltaproteobacteria bacterium]
MDKKHPCPDCRECLRCSDERCRLCLKGKSCRRKKLTMTEQIALYEEINRAGDCLERGSDIPATKAGLDNGGNGDG